MKMQKKKIDLIKSRFSENFPNKRLLMIQLGDNSSYLAYDEGFDTSLPSLLGYKDFIGEMNDSRLRKIFYEVKPDISGGFEIWNYYDEKPYKANKPISPHN